MKIGEFMENGLRVQNIIVGAADKYGIAMIAYFRNSMLGNNANEIAISDLKKVTISFDTNTESYVLKIVGLRISGIENHYRHFVEEYETLIKDPISHLKQ